MTTPHHRSAVGHDFDGRLAERNMSQTNKSVSTDRDCSLLTAQAGQGHIGSREVHRWALSLLVIVDPGSLWGMAVDAPDDCPPPPACRPRMVSFGRGNRYGTAELLGN